uniref:Transposon TX1 n=1 Tax=Tanacetum cinerariifolium TaxID=118510 RepID=A0A699H0I0_TANCI|nr:transposon TX1 [Tanacetum cinerariifolium]
MREDFMLRKMITMRVSLSVAEVTEWKAPYGPMGNEVIVARDVESLLRQLQRIKMGADWLRVFVAYDRRNNGNVKPRKGNVRMESSGNGFMETREGNTNSMGSRRFADVMNSGINKDRVNKFEKSPNGVGVQPNGNEIFTMVKDKKWTWRTIQVEEKDINSVILGRSVVGEGDTLHRTSGRMSWINILGIPLSCWGKGVFKRISASHGSNLAMHNYRLEGNQNLIYGMVQIHTVNKGLINKELNVTDKWIDFKVNVVEEIRDITNIDIHDVVKSSHGDKKKNDTIKGNDIEVDDEEDGNYREFNTEGVSLVMKKKVMNTSRGMKEAADKVRFPDGFKKRVDINGGNSIIDVGVNSEEHLKCDSEEHLKCSAKLVNEYVDKKCGEASKNLGNNGNGPTVESHMDGNGLDNLKGNGSLVEAHLNGNRLDNLEGDSIKESNENNRMSLTNKYICRGNKRVSKTYVVEYNNKQQDDHIGVMTVEELEHDSLKNIREKHEISLFSSVGSRGNRLRKKRKACNEGFLEDNVDEVIFNQGKSGGEKSEGKKKIGRRSVTKVFVGSNTWINFLTCRRYNHLG